MQGPLHIDQFVSRHNIQDQISPSKGGKESLHLVDTGKAPFSKQPSKLIPEIWLFVPIKFNQIQNKYRKIFEDKFIRISKIE